MDADERQDRKSGLMPGSRCEEPETQSPRITELLRKQSMSSYSTGELRVRKFGNEVRVDE